MMKILMLSLFIVGSFAQEDSEVPCQPEGFNVPKDVFVRFCLGNEKVNRIVEKEEECRSEIALALQQHAAALEEAAEAGDEVSQHIGFLTYIESYFAPQLCVMRKLDLLTDEGKVDEEKMNQFFESNQAHKVFGDVEGHCDAEMMTEDVNHFFESWEDLYREAVDSADMMPPVEEGEEDRARRRKGSKRRPKRGKKAKKAKKAKEASMEVDDIDIDGDDTDICSYKDEMKHSVVKGIDGSELDVLEEFCALDATTKQLITEVMRPMAYWKCLKETRFTMCGYGLIETLNQMANLPQEE